MRDRVKKVVIAKSGTVSAGFSLESHEIFVGAIFPDMDAGNIGLEYSIDAGTTYNPILDSANGADLLGVASGAAPGVIDISDFIRFVHANNEHLLRFTCAAQTTAAVTVTILLRG
jgi:hypothetical protein